MKEFLDKLSERDRMLLAVAVSAVIVAGMILAWHSFSGRIDRLQDIVADQHMTLDYMKQSAREVQSLRGQAPQRSSGGQSLMALMDKTARQAGLSGAVKRIEPEGQNKVRVRLEGAVFDDLMRWLEALGGGYGIQVESVTIDRQDTIGMVNARLTLTGGQG